MKARAAVAWKAGAPLNTETADLQGLAVEIKARHRPCVDGLGLRGRPRELEDINEGFALMECGESMRSVVVF